MKKINICLPILKEKVHVNFSVEEESVFKPYNFRMDEIDGFRYRAKVSFMSSP